MYSSLSYLSSKKTFKILSLNVLKSESTGKQSSDESRVSPFYADCLITLLNLLFNWSFWSMLLLGCFILILWTWILIMLNSASKVIPETRYLSSNSQSIFGFKELNGSFEYKMSLSKLVSTKCFFYLSTMTGLWKTTSSINSSYGQTASSFWVVSLGL